MPLKNYAVAPGFLPPKLCRVLKKTLPLPPSGRETLAGTQAASLGGQGVRKYKKKIYKKYSRYVSAKWSSSEELQKLIR